MDEKLCGRCAYLKDDSPLVGDDRWVCHCSSGRYSFCRPEDKGCKSFDTEADEEKWLDIDENGWVLK